MTRSSIRLSLDGWQVDWTMKTCPSNALFNPYRHFSVAEPNHLTGAQGCLNMLGNGPGQGRLEVQLKIFNLGHNTFSPSSQSTLLSACSGQWPGRSSVIVDPAAT